MILRKRLPGALGIVLALGVGAFAQEAQTQTPAQEGPRRDSSERMERHRQRLQQREGLRGHEGMGRRRGMERLAEELKLTDEQRKQSRAIMQRSLEGLKGQREELFRLREKRIAGTFNDEDAARAKALREEMRNAMRGARAEMQGVLTSEQRARLDQLKADRKQKMEERMKMRQERLQERQERLKLQ
ncbi:MAG TPA: Spy/CpxP family protein refolding chaperone [Pyrinomonadaceae bacterium]|nr:Spy/CpxP family protein refolding chaperone [Pyrinomonadaceae bacterium]